MKQGRQHWYFVFFYCYSWNIENTLLTHKTQQSSHESPAAAYHGAFTPKAGQSDSHEWRKPAKFALFAKVENIKLKREFRLTLCRKKKNYQHWESWCLSVKSWCWSLLAGRQTGQHQVAREIAVIQTWRRWNSPSRVCLRMTLWTQMRQRLVFRLPQQIQRSNGCYFGFGRIFMGK